MNARTHLPGAILALVALVCGPAALLAENFVAVGYGQGSPGDRDVEVIITASNDVEIHGYSLALSYPSEALRLEDISVDRAHVAFEQPEFVAPSVDNGLGVASLGVIMEFGDGMTGGGLAPLDETSAPRIVARLIFDVLADAPGGVYPLRLVDGIGAPASFNRFTERGTSVTPRLIDGSFSVDGGNTLILEKKLVFRDAWQNAEIVASAIHPDPLAGFSIAIAYDCGADSASAPLVLNVEASGFAGTDLDFLVGANRIEFYKTDMDDSFRPRCRSRTVAIFDYVAPLNGQTLPPAPQTPHTLMRFRFRDGPTRETLEYRELVLENLDLPGAIQNSFLVGVDTILPRRVHGKIYFSEGKLHGRVLEATTSAPVAGVSVVAEPGGARATTNSAGEFLIDPMVPGRYALVLSKDGYHFARHENIGVEGKSLTSETGDLAIYKEPSGVINPGVARFVRGDVNDDERVDLSDAVFALNWLFKGNAAPRCLHAADTNDTDGVDISDPIFMLQWFFGGGAAIPAPYPDCGRDPSAGTLECPGSACDDA